MHDVAGVLETHCGTGVKTEPAEPKNKQSDNGKRHAVSGNRFWLAVFVVLSNTRTQDHSTGQCCPAPDGVYGRVTGEIHKAQVGEPAAAPNPVTYDGINNERKHERENNEGNVLNTFCNCAGNNGGGGTAEDKLEEELSPKWNI